MFFFLIVKSTTEPVMENSRWFKLMRLRKRESYNDLLGHALKREFFTFTVLIFYFQMILHHVANEEKYVIFFSKIVKIRTSVKTFWNFFRIYIYRHFEDWSYHFKKKIPWNVLYDFFFTILSNLEY